MAIGISIIVIFTPRWRLIDTDLLASFNLPAGSTFVLAIRDAVTIFFWLLASNLIQQLPDQTTNTLLSINHKRLILNIDQHPP